MDKPQQAPYLDAYTQNVMKAIDPQVFRTFNLAQLEAIKNAISASAPFRQHAVDVRGTLPLYFTKLYFVFLMGRDRRTTTRQKEELRRGKARSAGMLAMIYIFVSALIPVALLFLYLLKSLLGIDLFPDQHLSDFFNR